MPKVPADVSADQFCKALKKLGFQFVRQNKGHIVMTRPDPGGKKALAVFPDHRVLKRGTLSGVLKQAGVDLEEFLDNL